MQFAADPALLEGVPVDVVVVLELDDTVPSDVEMLVLVDDELLPPLEDELLVLTATVPVTGATAANLLPANAGPAAAPVARIDIALARSKRRVRSMKRPVMFLLTFHGVCELAAELSHGA